MVTRPLRPCTSPGCPTPVQEGRCDRHRRLAGQQRDHWTALYGREWPRLRLDYLSRHPYCVLRGPSCDTMAVVADHYPKGIRLLRKLGVDDPHADRRLRPLCWSCHSRETGKHHPGGWNRINR